mmetsp:Transcript_52051/g.167475  ORF Transcript_52051/g.167475 Transcript_52051/m.167475 type:complete len:183 (-) Transcript_52051:153-701(-)
MLPPAFELRPVPQSAVATAAKVPMLGLRGVMPRSLSAPPRPKGFVPQKWRVTSESLAVFATEHLDSVEVRVLAQGEIVESVGPPFTLPSGVVRLEIAHPSSAAYPSPIGWVSQDDAALGGGRCLEPGPQPVQAGLRTNRMSAPGYNGGGGWRPRSAPYRPFRPRGASFTNITWRPTPAAGPS